MLVERNEKMKLKMRLLLGDYEDISENKEIRTVRVKSKKVLKGMFPEGNIKDGSDS